MVATVNQKICNGRDQGNVWVTKDDALCLFFSYRLRYMHSIVGSVPSTRTFMIFGYPLASFSTLFTCSTILETISLSRSVSTQEDELV